MSDEVHSEEPTPEVVIGERLSEIASALAELASAMAALPEQVAAQGPGFKIEGATEHLSTLSRSISHLEESSMRLNGYLG